MFLPKKNIRKRKRKRKRIKKEYKKKQLSENISKTKKKKKKKGFSETPLSAIACSYYGGHLFGKIIYSSFKFSLLIPFTFHIYFKYILNGKCILKVVRF